MSHRCSASCGDGEDTTSFDAQRWLESQERKLSAGYNAFSTIGISLAFVLMAGGALIMLSTGGRIYEWFRKVTTGA